MLLCMYVPFVDGRGNGIVSGRTYSYVMHVLLLAWTKRAAGLGPFCCISLAFKTISITCLGTFTLDQYN
uniref:Uncharacterized protein n=1 Tax=Arundo donax TaxID=35708 RepID=A0A0A9HV05_ARUDO